jgi:hypothetical protein
MVSAGKTAGDTAAVALIDVSPVPLWFCDHVLIQPLRTARAGSVRSRVDPPTLLNLACSLLT